MKLQSISCPHRVQSKALVIYLALTVVILAGCTKPRQTTAIGSGVGGAIGAGLGALVGNQTGNAGSGLAVGAGAGAAVGALVGNAMQAQEERNKSQDEALKRQERVIQAQKSEINELRLVRGDDTYTYNSANSSTPRYHYRGTTINPASPEVSRQQMRLQQRGPRPTHSRGAAAYTPNYYQPPRHTAPTKVQVPPAILPSVTTNSSKPLARYDVRSELATPKSTTSKTSPIAKSDLEPLLKTEEKALEKGGVKSTEINEIDLPALNKASGNTIRAVAPTAALQAQSKECKEALSERDLAMEATDNSDKLFHLRRALRLCPHSAPLHHELGRVYASMQRTRDAEEEFKQALSIDPSLSAAKRELGAILKDEVQF